MQMLKQAAHGSSLKGVTFTLVYLLPEYCCWCTDPSQKGQ